MMEAMDKMDASIERQSKKAFEERERQQMRYLWQRYVICAYNRSIVARTAAWMGFAMTLAVGLTQVVPGIQAIFKSLGH